MEQNRLDGEVVPVEVWVKVEVKEELEWADRLPQGREEIVSARNAATKFLML